MKRNISLVTNLLLSSTLFWGVPAADGQEGVIGIPAETTSYCHMEFPIIRQDTLFSVDPLLNETAGNIATSTAGAITTPWEPMKLRPSGGFCDAGLTTTNGR